MWPPGEIEQSQTAYYNSSLPFIESTLWARQPKNPHFLQKAFNYYFMKSQLSFKL